MKIRFLFWWDRLPTSLWFLPTIMATSAVASFLLTLQIDRRLGSSWDGTW